MPSYRDPQDYEPSRRSRGYAAYDGRYEHGHSSRRSSTHRGMTSHSRREEARDIQAWVSRVDSDDPRVRTGIRYFAETDTFSIPPGKRAGPFVGPCEVDGREFVHTFPQGNTADLRRRKLAEYMTTGRIANRGSGADRFGNPWVGVRSLYFKYDCTMLGSQIR